jgi:hypothetical protein
MATGHSQLDSGVSGWQWKFVRLTSPVHWRVFQRGLFNREPREIDERGNACLFGYFAWFTVQVLGKWFGFESRFSLSLVTSAATDFDRPIANGNGSAGDAQKRTADGGNPSAAECLMN